MIRTRSGRTGDLARVLEIQTQSPTAAQWAPASYLGHYFRVAEIEGQLVAFLVARSVCPGEWEILNLATGPQHRRNGCARGLILELLEISTGAVFLEVRESNHAARKLYHSLGFIEANIRKNYYGDPPESAIVLKFHSC